MQDTSHVTTLTLDLGRIRDNFKVVRQHLKDVGGVEPGIVAVIKGFGYGTDDTVLAEVYANERVDYLAVAYVEEGVKLREAGINGRIMVLNPDPETFNVMGDHNLEPSLISMGHLDSYIKWVTSCDGPELEPVHLNFNTGMHRLGFARAEMAEVAKKLNGVSGLRLGTVYTHLAATESEDFDINTLGQINLFNSIIEDLRDSLSSGLKDFKTHSLNSSGVVRFPSHGMDYVRVGLSLLGSELSSAGVQLKPAVYFKTVVAQIQNVPAGSGVGYGYADPADLEREIAWLPVGYADGYPRSLSDGRGRVWVNGRSAVVVGRVCMDLTAVDVTGMGVQVGDEVELFGDNIAIEGVSKAAGTIAYELIARVHQRVIRLTLD